MCVFPVRQDKICQAELDTGISVSPFSCQRRNLRPPSHLCLHSSHTPHLYQCDGNSGSSHTFLHHTLASHTWGETNKHLLTHYFKIKHHQTELGVKKQQQYSVYHSNQRAKVQHYLNGYHPCFREKRLDSREFPCLAPAEQIL